MRYLRALMLPLDIFAMFRAARGKITRTVRQCMPRDVDAHITPCSRCIATIRNVLRHRLFYLRRAFTRTVRAIRRGECAYVCHTYDVERAAEVRSAATMYAERLLPHDAVCADVASCHVYAPLLPMPV